MEEENQGGSTMALEERSGTLPSLNPPLLILFKELKRGKKIPSSSYKNINLFKGELSYMNKAKFAQAKERYTSLTKLDVGF